MKTIKHMVTDLMVKAWRSKTFEHALDDCTPEEVTRIKEQTEENKKHFDSWQEYASSASEFIVIDGKMFWIFLDAQGLEVLHRYNPLGTSVIDSDGVCFISQSIGRLVGPSDGNGNLLSFVNDKKSRTHFAGRAFLTRKYLARDLGFKVSELVCAVN